MFCIGLHVYSKYIFLEFRYVIDIGIILFYVVGSKIFRPDELFKVTEIKQLCYFST